MTISRAAGLLLVLAALVAGLAWWTLWGLDPDAPTEVGPSLEVEVEAFDVIAAFDRGDTGVRVLAQTPEMPLRAAPASSLDTELRLASDADHKVVHARAESAFEVDAGPFAAGARLLVRTLVHSAHRKQPELADPAPVTFRVLVDGEERAALSSAYVREVEGHEHPYDQVMRTLDIPLDGAVGRPVTLRFETTRGGAAVPDGVTLAEPVWWRIVVRQPLAVPRQRASRRAPNILVLLVDTLAAGRTSLHGYRRETTPALDALAGRGTLFEHARSPSSWTLPSTATLLTGLPPNTHGVLGDTRSYLMDSLQTWPELLRLHGLEGAAFVANPLVAVANNFQQGFGTWVQANEETAEQLDARLLAWIDGQPDGARWFAYVHYMDPHAPYGAPGEGRERFTGDYVEARDFGGFLPNALQRGEIEPFDDAARGHVVDLYDGEVAYWDRCLGELLQALEQRGVLDETLIVLTSDHGEELFEHGGLGHGYALTEVMLRVPLVLAGPGVKAGVRWSAPVSTEALAATLLGFGGVGSVAGLAPALPPVGPGPGQAPLFATVRTQLFGPLRNLAAARDAAGRKVTVVLADEGDTATEVLRYDLRSDSAERMPLDPAALDVDERAAFDALVQRVLDWHAETSSRRPPEPQPFNSAMRESLEQVGYVGTAVPARPEEPDDG